MKNAYSPTFSYIYFIQKKLMIILMCSSCLSKLNFLFDERNDAPGVNFSVAQRPRAVLTEVLAQKVKFV